jgi:hypothetical protein
MALVKCTKEIRTHVIEKIEALFKERITKAYELRERTTEEIAEEVYSKIFTPDRLKVILEMEAGITKNCKQLHDSRDFSFVARTPIGAERKISVTWGKLRPCFAEFTSSYNVPEVRNLTAESIKAIEEASQRRRAVMDEREAFKAGFTQAVDKVKSINELIKLWPAVIELLPAGTMERVNRKTGPRVKQGDLFDAASLNVQLLKAKVAK